jgi:hypothetical protein
LWLVFAAFGGNEVYPALLLATYEFTRENNDARLNMMVQHTWTNISSANMLLICCIGLRLLLRVRVCVCISAPTTFTHPPQDATSHIEKRVRSKSKKEHHISVDFEGIAAGVIRQQQNESCSETHHSVQIAPTLNVVVSESAAVLQLLALKDEAF